MKKILRIGIIVSSLVFGILAGINIQKYIFVEEVEKGVSIDKIAIVNLDSGYEKENGEVINYSNELIEKEEYLEYTGLQKAKEGVEADVYAAYVIIPEDFSITVESINTKPNAANLKYQINANLSEESKDKTVENLMNLEKGLEYKVGYLYLTTIIGEFQSGQNAAGKVLDNDQKDIEAINQIDAINLVSQTTITEQPQIINNITVLDITTENSNNAMLYTQITNNNKDSKDQIDITNTAVVNEINTFNLGADPDIDDLLKVVEVDLNSPNKNEMTKYVEDVMDETQQQVEIDFETKFKGLSGTAYVLDPTHTIINVSGDDYVKLSDLKELQYKPTGDPIKDANKEFIEDGTNPLNVTTTISASGIETELTNEYNNILTKLKTTASNEIARIAREVENKQESLVINTIDPNNEAIQNANDSIENNNQGIETKVNEKISEYSKTKAEVEHATSTYIQEVRESVMTSKEETNQKITEELSTAKAVKENSVTTNKELLNDFIEKIPNSKVASGQNTKFKEQVLSPVKSEKYESVTKTKEVQEKLDINLIIMGVVGVILVVLIGMNLIKREDNEEA